MVVYFDTSALVKLYVLEESGRELVREALKEATRVATSTVAYAEARAGLSRNRREGVFTEEQHRRAVSDLDADWPAYSRLAVSDEVARRAGVLAERHALRGFDAIHLASASRFAEEFEDLRFLAFDDRLSRAAGEASIPSYTGANVGPGEDVGGHHGE